jgi:Protein of unknown function (DUF3175)
MVVGSDADGRSRECLESDPAIGQAKRSKRAVISTFEGGVFASNDPHEIAASLKKSAEKS